MKTITNKQKVLLETIRHYILINGYSPSVRELAELMKVNSPTSIQDKLVRLKDKGYITFEPNRARTIKVLDV